MCSSTSHSHKNNLFLTNNVDQSRAATVASLETSTGTLLNDVTKSVYHINVNQQKIEAELKSLQTLSSNFNKNVGRWLGLYRDLNESLKQLGDVANWSTVIEADMRFICRVLDNSAALMTGQEEGLTENQGSLEISQQASAAEPSENTTPETAAGASVANPENDHGKR